MSTAVLCQSCSLETGQMYVLVQIRVVDLTEVLGYRVKEYRCPHCKGHVLVEVR